MIHFSHGHALHERCPGSETPVWIDGASHNNVEEYPEYVDELTRFLDKARASQLASRETVTV